MGRKWSLSLFCHHKYLLMMLLVTKNTSLMFIFRTTVWKFETLAPPSGSIKKENSSAHSEFVLT